MSDQLVWSSGDADGPRVLLRNCGSYCLIVLEARGRQMAVMPSVAAMLASGIDEGLRRVGRDGRLRRPA